MFPVGWLGLRASPEIHPMSGGEMASPRAWMTKIDRANAVARIAGCVTLATIVLVGPVLSNRQNSAIRIHPQAYGNGVTNTSSSIGNPTSMLTPDTRK